MSDQQNNVRYIWQLLSQFVSWEFCRYMCEQDENMTETDVLTYLRDMIVQRTEKSVSDITKHEIVAKFIMETRSVQNISRMPCITALSESVNNICPELEQATNKLVRHLETFLNVLDSTDECRKQLIQARINDSINDFSKVAKQLLPEPELLKVVESWNLHHGHVPQNPAKRVIYNSTLFEKVLECLHCESISPSEAKLIAVALYEDKVFEKILLSAEAELNETEADSEQFSLSLQSSQQNEHIFSQEFGKNIKIQMNYASVIAKSSTLQPALQTSSSLPDTPNEIYDEPPQLSPIQAPVQSSHVQFSPVNFALRNISELHGGQNVQNNDADNHMQFAQSSDIESPSSELNTAALDTRIHKKFKIINYQRTQNQSDSDTSDCDKNPHFKFLTPTLYKQGTDINAPPKSQVVWLSDNDSNDSSIITMIANSQQNDPNWSVRQENRIPVSRETNRKKQRKTQTQALHSSNYNWNESSDSDSDNNSSNRIPANNDPFSMKMRLLSDPATAMKTQDKLTKKKVRQLESDSSESIHSSLIENEGNLLHRLQQMPVMTVNGNDAEAKRPTKKKKVVNLFTPNRSIQEFVIPIRKPVPVVLNEAPVHKGTSTIQTRRKRGQNLAKSPVRKYKCKDCDKRMKTAANLRRHIFLKHTVPPGDSDCDT